MDQIDARSKMLGVGKVSKVITKLAVPAIIGMLVNAVYNFVDTMFVSWIGTNAMSAAQVGFPVFMILVAFGQLFGIGGSSYTSRLLGESKKEEASKTITVVYITTVISGIVLGICGLVFLNPLVNMFGANSDNLSYTLAYTSILFVGAPFILGNMALNNMLRAEGSAIASMCGLMLGAVLNIILDPIFIFVFDMGVGGAALATIIAQGITTLFLLSYYIRKKSVVRMKLSRFKPSKKIYSEVFKIGLPTLIRQLLASISIGLMNKAATGYSTEAVAAIGIVSKIFMMGFYALLGYTQGFLPVAGYNYGAKKYQRVLDAIKVSNKVSTIYCVIVFAVFTIFARPIVMIFRPEPVVADIAIKGLRIWAISMPVLGYSMVINMLFQAIGKAKEAALLSISRQGIMLIPLLLILPKLFDLNGVLSAQPIADVMTFILTMILGIIVNKELNKLNDGDKKISKAA
ncbi:MATE family efflux transporter [Vallitalea longa]|uniref:Multidrug export protein MepA n=1 Tax=Vallitalea longa TaxID=2936439 RepID=A0A9W6DEE6_9FIRM|nr:MATE family efflux transporter [Vallitalea longa]GKX28368.1 MATE family efflux transporter [Vallitalea longa]